MKSPEITVVLPAYNAAKHLKEAIESILNQTFSDFTLLILNDGSTDETEQIVLSFNDIRIRYVKNDQNIGLTATLNKAIDLTDTHYFARMDGDDIAVKERLQWQIDFMNAHPEIGICGGLFEMFGDESGISKSPLTDDEIKASLLFANSICHPSVIIRTDILKKNKIGFGVPIKYSDDYGHKILELEDYGIWHKLKAVAKFANIDKVVLKYRKEGQNLSSQKKDLILERKQQFYEFLLKELNVNADPLNLLIHISSGYVSKLKTPQGLLSFRKHLDLLLKNNLGLKIYSQKALEKAADQKWEQLFYYLPEKGNAYVFTYFKITHSLKLRHLSYFLKFLINNTIRKKR